MARLNRNLFSTVLVMLILYAGIHALSRTEGARTAIADKISNGTRQPVALKECAATPLLGLRLKGVSFQGVEIPEAIVSFNWFSFLSHQMPFVRQLDLVGAEVKFKRVPGSGYWEPLVLNEISMRLGEAVGLESAKPSGDGVLPKFPAYVINARTMLQLRGGTVAWFDESGRELALLSGVVLGVKDGRFIDRRVLQTIIECAKIRLASGRSLDGFRLEAFRVEGADLVMVLEMSDSAGSYDAFASETLWADLNRHLAALSKL